MEFFPLKVDGVWNGWMQWSECTVSCGYGTRNRSRTCKVHIIKEKNAMDQRMKPSLVTPFPVQVDAFDRQKKFTI